MNTDKLQLAKLLSIHLHQNQRYGGWDYFETHILTVYNKVCDCLTTLPQDFVDLYSEDLKILAYLHDVLEDSDFESEMIEMLFGMNIAHSLCLLSKSYMYGSKRVKALSYESYIEGIKSDPLALIVKICDTKANLEQSMRDGNEKRINKYTKQLQMLES